MKHRWSMVILATALLLLTVRDVAAEKKSRPVAKPPAPPHVVHHRPAPAARTRPLPNLLPPKPNMGKLSGTPLPVKPGLARAGRDPSNTGFQPSPPFVSKGWKPPVKDAKQSAAEAKKLAAVAAQQKLILRPAAGQKASGVLTLNDLSRGQVLLSDRAGSGPLTGMVPQQAGANQGPSAASPPDLFPGPGNATPTGTAAPSPLGTLLSRQPGRGTASTPTDPRSPQMGDGGILLLDDPVTGGIPGNPPSPSSPYGSPPGGQAPTNLGRSVDLTKNPRIAQASDSFVGCLADYAGAGAAIGTTSGAIGGGIAGALVGSAGGPPGTLAGAAGGAKAGAAAGAIVGTVGGFIVGMINCAEESKPTTGTTQPSTGGANGSGQTGTGTTGGSTNSTSGTPTSGSTNGSSSGTSGTDTGTTGSGSGSSTNGSSGGSTGETSGGSMGGSTNGSTGSGSTNGTPKSTPNPNGEQQEPVPSRQERLEASRYNQANSQYVEKLLSKVIANCLNKVNPVPMDMNRSRAGTTVPQSGNLPDPPPPFTRQAGNQVARGNTTTGSGGGAIQSGTPSTGASGSPSNPKGTIIRGPFPPGVR